MDSLDALTTHHKERRANNLQRMRDMNADSELPRQVDAPERPPTLSGSEVKDDGPEIDRLLRAIRGGR